MQVRRYPYPPRLTRRVFLSGATTAAVATTLATAGCQSKGRGQSQRSPAGTAHAGGSPQPGGVYEFSRPANPPILDPQRSSTSLTMDIAGAVYSLLFRYQLSPDPKVTANHVIENDLALSSESPDAVTWTIKLRPNVRFQDVPPVSGRPVSAEDVKGSFVRALTLPENPNKGPLGMIDPAQIELPAADTVVFKLRYPYAPFLNTLAAPVYSWILPREATGGGYDPAKTLIGSGPFLFGSHTPDVETTLKKNPDWFVPGQPYVDGVHIAIIPDQLAAEAQFRGGHLDEVIVTQNDLQTTQQGSPNATALTSNGAAINTYYFQLGDPASPFMDVRLRRAISMAIDRDALGRAAFGQYEPAFSVPGFFGDWALHMNQLDNSTAPYYRYDLAAAKQLFAEAGGSTLSVRLVYVVAGELEVTQKPVTEGVYKMLQALPWQVALGTADFYKDFIGGGKGYNYGHLPLGWIFDGGQSGLSDPDAYIYNYYHSKSPRSEENLSDLTLDGMIDKARTILDTGQRKRAYVDVQKYIADKVYSIGGMPAAYNYTLVQPRVQNYGFTYEAGNNAMKWARLWLTK